MHMYIDTQILTFHINWRHARPITDRNSNPDPTNLILSVTDTGEYISQTAVAGPADVQRHEGVIGVSPLASL